MQLIAFIVIALAWPTAAIAQRIQFPAAGGLRPVTSGQMPTTGNPVMVPINPATQAGIFPSTGVGSPTFDPYSRGNSGVGGFGGGAVPLLPSGNLLGGAGFGGPAYGGVSPTLPGAGQSATIGTFPSTPSTLGQPGVYPNSSPSALFPGAYGRPAASGSWFGGLFSNLFGRTGNSFGGYPQPPAVQPNYNGSILPPNVNLPNLNIGGGANWNPPGSVFSGTGGYPQFVRLFQGPRFRHGYVHGNDDTDALMINDTDVSAAFAIPNFLYSTQPLYLLPSFSLHQWDGPHPPSSADLPALAYSAFLDSGWQSDPARILGGEFGLRVGMFTDFDTATSDSLRIMGRGIGRIRITPRATVKLGVLYLDRNKIKLLPAGGLLWQPNPDTRFDIFFPEPKLAHYLSTVGNSDMWWYVGGYYGGGSWTVTRADSSTDSIDINDLRLVLGLEWGRNEQMREGRRIGFVEVGFVFDRELLYDLTPADNMGLQDTIMVRAGFGY